MGRGEHEVAYNEAIYGGGPRAGLNCFFATDHQVGRSLPLLSASSGYSTHPATLVKMGAVQSTTTTSSMAATATSTSIAATATATLAPYTLQDDYLSGGNFFNQFTFFTDPDPTHGTVQYVNQSIATSLNMIASSASSVYIGAEYNKIQPSGRPSVRITSKKSYDSALVIVDLAHMPQGCGTWPAFWMLGPNWPNAGEIDIIEYVFDEPFKRTMN